MLPVGQKCLLQNLPRLIRCQERHLGDWRAKPWLPRQKRPLEFATGRLEWARPLLEQQKEQLEKEGQEEIPSEPPKLFAVSRLKKSLKGVPKRERYILKTYFLEEKHRKGPSEYVIVKNSEFNAQNLKKVKHLIKIVPITFPNGLPKDESDYPHTLLKETGEFIVKPRVEGQIVEDDPKGLVDLDTKKKHLQRVLDGSRFLAEYHPAQYRYKFNQDGKEYRYNDELRKK
ncbi:uncharacterized protein LOC135493689 isoform X2 [Lineus longissimus]|uniref:uncharacterized protein LOC135493689 isoform X2 n=1 Tax=Lineus longissimus TaxID=88925 RepID=UPI002B4D7E74